MAGASANSHGAQINFPENPEHGIYFDQEWASMPGVMPVASASVPGERACSSNPRKTVTSSLSLAGFTVTPAALGRILTVTGPVRVKGYDRPITGANAASMFTNGVYSELPMP